MWNLLLVASAGAAQAHRPRRPMEGPRRAAVRDRSPGSRRLPPRPHPGAGPRDFARDTDALAQSAAARRRDRAHRRRGAGAGGTQRGLRGGSTPAGRGQRQRRARRGRAPRPGRTPAVRAALGRPTRRASPASAGSTTAGDRRPRPGPAAPPGPAGDRMTGPCGADRPRRVPAVLALRPALRRAARRRPRPAVGLVHGRRGGDGVPRRRPGDGGGRWPGAGRCSCCWGAVACAGPRTPPTSPPRARSSACAGRTAPSCTWSAPAHPARRRSSWPTAGARAPRSGPTCGGR